MLGLYSVLMFLCVFVLSVYAWSIYQNVGKKYPPGPWGFPIVGHLPLLGTHPQYKFQQWRVKFGDVFRIRMGGWETVVINGYSAIKKAMESKGNVLSDRPKFFSANLLKIAYKGRYSLSFGPFNQETSQLRKLTMRALHTYTNTNTTHTQEIIHKEVENLVDELLALKGKPLYTEDLVRAPVGNIMYQILYGKEKDPEEGDFFKVIIASIDEFVTLSATNSPVDVMPWIAYVMPWKTSQFLRVASQALDAVSKHILEHLDIYDGTDIRSVLDVLIAANKNSKDQTDKHTERGYILVALFELMTAGQETMVSTLCWIITYLIVYPRVQTRIQKEIDEVVGSDRRVDLNDLPKLCYTEATIFEALRIRSAVPLCLPRCTVKDTQLDGFDIDKETVVIVNIHSANMDEAYWTDPDDFRPERLLNANNELDIDKCRRIITFGLGRRGCLGKHLAKMEIFLLLANLLQRCSLTKVGNEPIDLTPVQLLTIKPKPIKVRVLERPM